jgi:hypothetical protein
MINKEKRTPMTKARFLILSFGLIIMMLLAACTGGTTSPPAEAPAEEAPAAEAPAEEAPAAEAPAEITGKILRDKKELNW